MANKSLTDKTISLTDLFAEKIGIPLRNQQWSWGVYDNENDRVILRVWADEIDHDRSGQRVLVIRQGWNHSHGYSERLNQLQRLRDGATGFGIVCEAREKADEKRGIKSYNCEMVVKLGDVFSENADTYARIIDWAPIHELFRTSSWQHDIAGDISKVLKDNSLDETTKKRLVDARVGQGKFRTDLLARWGNRCSVTGVRTPEVLRASHIKPWKDSNNDERLDPANGLLLVGTLDLLFDRGLIGFSETGQLLVSPLLDPSESSAMGLSTDTKLRDVPSNSTIVFLSWHHQLRFRSKPLSDAP